MTIQKGGLRVTSFNSKKLLNYFFYLTFLLTPLIMYGQADLAVQIKKILMDIMGI